MNPMRLRSKRALLSCFALFFFFMLGSPSLADEPFQTPKGLESSVDFWIKVFTRYKRNQAVVHDTEDPSLIYDVVNLDGSGGPSSAHVRRRRAKHARERYARLFRTWSVSPPRPRDLSRKERRIIQALRKRRYDLSKAARNVRAQQGVQEQFRDGIIRSGRYLRRMRRVFLDYGLPPDLTYLPHVESSFNYGAYSKSGASGVWQFTRSTGRLFLKINYDIDERRDPMLSTHAAAKLLRRNHKELGTWPLAVTAYNHGRTGIARAVRLHQTRHLPTLIRKYRGRTFKFASKNFYAEFLAARIVAKNARRYFGPLREMRPPRDRVFRLPAYVSMETLTKISPVTLEEIQRFNPALRGPVLRGERRIPKGYLLRLPARKTKDFRRRYASMSASLKHADQKRIRWYRVRRGETLGAIARRFRMSVRTLASVNNIRNTSRVRAGMIISIPGLRRTAAARPAQRKRRITNARIRAAAAPAVKRPKAKPARAVKALEPAPRVISPAVSSRSARTNGTENGNQTRPEWRERELSRVHVTGKSGKQGWTRVEAEETLSHFAEWLGASKRVLRRLNRMGRKQSIRMGQKLKLSFRRVNPEEFEQSRLEYHKSLENDFFETYRIVRTFHHTIRKGESLWGLAREVYEVPFWIMARYNPRLFNSSLAVGVKVTFPVVVRKGRKTSRN
jgi:membrane-bound lytic murein transglycosylase D